ncbi:hypothetical protein IMAU80824_01415 [Lactiplantibacillus plantarum]|nr:hypothetical protein [Lactiplantibacillus plantarum]MCG0945214.1 hypothetical protein [Lactiplantibacillus plantarum]
MGLRQLFNSEYYNLIVSYDQKAWDHDTYRIDMVDCKFNPNFWTNLSA